jgi:glutamyl-tRNA reductase
VPVLALGLNHKTAPVALLERVAVPADRLPKALGDLRDREPVLEVVVLSTCNRVEVYAHVTRFHAGVAALRDFLCMWGGLAPEDLDGRCYDYFDERAAQHLFAVTSGLDSMVVGERQVALQVKQAFNAAEAEGATGRVLGSLFRQALRVGRRTRTETGISEGASSMVAVGLDAARQVLGPLDGATVLLVGAGKMGGMAARRVADEAGTLLVANRTAEKADRLVAAVGGERVALDDLTPALARADLVCCSTGAAAPLVDVATVRAALTARAGRPLVLLDLAVPRDVDPAVADLPGVTVLDVDAVHALTVTGTTGVEVERARAIVTEETERFASWRRTVAVEPTIAALREHAEEIRAAEVERAESRLAGLDERERETVEALTRRIVNTLLHEPSVRLKQFADAGGGDADAAALRSLFDL